MKSPYSQSSLAHTVLTEADADMMRMTEYVKQSSGMQSSTKVFKDYILAPESYAL